MKKPIVIIVTAAVAGFAAVLVFSEKAPSSLKTAVIPSVSEMVYHFEGSVYVMDRNGGNVTRLTFTRKAWEHVAVSHDRRYIAGNEQLPNPSGDAGGHSRLWLIDLAEGAETRLVPRFLTAGNGGVDWDSRGFIYFSGKEGNPISSPKTPADFITNAGANDVYKIKFDGTGLTRLTNTRDRGAADVSVSPDGSLVAFMDVAIRPPEDFTEIWVAECDGANSRLVYTGGKPGVESVHDPEISPDNRHVIFSRVNSSVPPNFPRDPVANTAHDIWRIGLDGTGLTRLTQPGPISIIPDWKGNSIVYFEASEKENYVGGALINPNDTGQTPKRIRPGVNSLKWIP